MVERLGESEYTQTPDQYRLGLAGKSTAYYASPEICPFKSENQELTELQSTKDKHNLVADLRGSHAYVGGPDKVEEDFACKRWSDLENSTERTFHCGIPVVGRVPRQAFLAVCIDVKSISMGDTVHAQFSYRSRQIGGGWRPLKIREISAATFYKDGSQIDWREKLSAGIAFNEIFSDGNSISTN